MLGYSIEKDAEEEERRKLRESVPVVSAPPLSYEMGVRSTELRPDRCWTHWKDFIAVSVAINCARRVEQMWPFWT